MKKSVHDVTAINHSSAGVVFRKRPVINTKVFFWHAAADCIWGWFCPAWQSPCGTTLLPTVRIFWLIEALSLNAAAACAIIFAEFLSTEAIISVSRCAWAARFAGAPAAPPWLLQQQTMNARACKQNIFFQTRLRLRDAYYGAKLSCRDADRERLWKHSLFVFSVGSAINIANLNVRSHARLCVDQIYWRRAICSFGSTAWPHEWLCFRFDSLSFVLQQSWCIFYTSGALGCANANKA